jgi:peptide/nickel transport system substrate-binding protein
MSEAPAVLPALRHVAAAGLSFLLAACGQDTAPTRSPDAKAAAASGAPAAGNPAATGGPHAFSDAARRSLRGGSDERPRPGGTIVQAISAEFQTLNNIVRISGAEESLCRTYLFPPLLDLDPDTLDLVPLLAESRPTVSQDKLTYTWTLRRGVRWQRGRPDGSPVEVTSADFEFSWRMIHDPEVRAERARASLDRFAGVKAMDERTFVVTLKEPYFRAEFEFGFNFRLMPAHLAAQDAAGFNKDPLGRAPVGYGPYRFEEWKAGEYVALVRNPDWFAADRLPYWIERLRIHFVPELERMPLLFERGELSICAVNDAAKYEGMKKDPALAERATFHEYYLPQWNYVVWNQAHPAFADARVRRAMTMLYPREAVREKVYLGHAEVISGPWSVAAKEYDPAVSPLPFDPAAAAKLLDEAGWIDRDGDGLRDKDGRPFRFELKRPRASLPAFETGNLWFQEHLKATGIEMTPRALDNRQLFEELSDRNFDAGQLGWTADPRDDDVFDRFHSSTIGRGGNYAGYRSEECDRLLEAYRREFDEPRRLEIAHEIHRRLAEDQPVTFLYNPQSLVVVSTKLRNAQIRRLGARWFDWWMAE